MSPRPAVAAARSIIRAKPAVVNGAPRSLTNTNGLAVALTLQTAKRAHLRPAQRVHAGGAALAPTDVQDRAIEIDLIPAQVHDLGRAQPVPEGDQDHGRIAVPVAVLPRRSHQRLDLLLGQVFAGSQVAFLARRGITVRFSMAGVTSLRCVLPMEIVLFIAALFGVQPFYEQSLAAAHGRRGMRRSAVSGTRRTRLGIAVAERRVGRSTRTSRPTHAEGLRQHTVSVEDFDASRRFAGRDRTAAHRQAAAPRLR